jgi:hypothetical protein
MHDQNEDIFYEGSTGWFRQVRLADLGDATALIPVESDLEGLGFEMLGDFVCSALTKSVNRAWANRERHVQALILVGATDAKLHIYAVFFDSLFADGASVTTTATAALKDKESKDAYRKVCVWTNAYNLFHEHQRYVEELRVRHGPTVPIAESLLSVIQTMDAATAQYG